MLICLSRITRNLGNCLPANTVRMIPVQDDGSSRETMGGAYAYGGYIAVTDTTVVRKFLTNKISKSQKKDSDQNSLLHTSRKNRTHLAIVNTEAKRALLVRLS
jgi:hypothetical protein